MIFAVVLVLLNTYPLVASQDLLFASKRDSLKSQTAVMASALMELESLDVHRAVVTDILIAPHHVEQVLPAVHPARVAQQQLHQVKFPGNE